MVLRVFLFFVLFCFANATTHFTIAPDGVSCSGDFEIVLTSVGCDNYCTWGSDVKLSGYATINNDLPSEVAQVTVKAANMVTIYDKEANFCDCLSSDSDATCPSAGAYTFEESAFTLPGNGDSWYSTNGYWGASVSIKAIFDFDGSKTTCTTTVELSKNSGYTMVGSAVLLLGLAGGALGIRRRRVASIQLGEEEGTQSHFEMMTNDAAVSV
jgi:hypothetical protein